MKLNLHDFIELQVESDGDVILIKRCEPGEQDGPASSVIAFPTDNLCYGINELEALQTELISYGCEDETVKRALREVTEGAYNEEYPVK
jgi:hypothetical protein